MSSNLLYNFDELKVEIEQDRSGYSIHFEDTLGFPIRIMIRKLHDDDKHSVINLGNQAVLTQKQMAELMPYFQKFVETGEL